MSNHSTQEEQIFEEALEKPSEAERSAFLDEACRNHPELRARLALLLEGHFRAEKFLNDRSDSLRASADEAIGSFIGRYKLLEKIGEGGFGAVYAAEQKEPVKRRVALKIIKLGMDTKQVVARFEAERQALALMDHPNIAKVHDGGATETGRPYFVMELVRGVPITNYCDENKLSVRERLALFMRVCQAVQHAHQKGIIHRDLKPSNILVTVNDGVAVPKVIDFGVAKATQQELTEKTILTQFHHFIGTPAYMSPEQAEMTSLDIDTRSDIYSLGVLLYELLTGRTPFDAKELLEAGLDAMRRIIREKEPVRPSTRVGTLGADELTTAAKRRHIDPPRLIKSLRGDLDWIVMKALDKDRTRRYETANALALDIRRHLADEPVSASAPSASYRFSKFAQRNKTALGVAATMAAILVIATVASTWQAIRATRERDAKEQARQEAEAISTFLTKLFRSPDPKRDGRTNTVAEYLNRAARKIESELASQPARRAHLQTVLGATYDALGLDREAFLVLSNALNYYLATLGREHPTTIQAMHNLAISVHASGQLDKALQLQEEELALSRKVNGPKHSSTLDAMNGLALSYHDVGRRNEALQLQEEVLASAAKSTARSTPIHSWR